MGWAARSLAEGSWAAHSLTFRRTHSGSTRLTGHLSSEKTRLCAVKSRSAIGKWRVEEIGRIALPTSAWSFLLGLDTHCCQGARGPINGAYPGAACRVYSSKLATNQGLVSLRPAHRPRDTRTCTLVNPSLLFWTSASVQGNRLPPGC